MTGLSYWSLVAIAAVATGIGLLWAWRRLLLRHRGTIVEEANTRLRLPIPASSLSGRDEFVGRLFDDAELLGHIDAAVSRQGQSRNQVVRNARRYAREIGPAFSAFFYFKLGFWLSRTLLRLHYRVCAVAVDNPGMDNISTDSTVILVCNHRSNMDPLIVTYLASRRSTIALSAGEWARLWPLHHLVRAAGGYVIDRSADDPLYRHVLGCYVRMAAASGVHHAVFPEGKLSTDGRMNSPNLGFLNYFCRAYSDERDIVFIPVGINYDQIPEDRKLAGAQTEFKAPGKLLLLASSLRYIGSIMRLPLSRREHRFGYACAAFGTPVSLKSWLHQNDIDPNELKSAGRYEWLAEFADDLMARCARQVPVPPATIIASVMSGNTERAEWRFADLCEQASRLVELLTANGAHVHIPGGLEKTLKTALETMSHRRFVRKISDGRYAMIPSELPVLRYYANSIAHLHS